MSKDLLIGILLGMTFLLCVYLTMFVFWKIDILTFQREQNKLMDSLEEMRETWNSSSVEER
jgi:hypothetical protein